MYIMWALQYGIHDNLLKWHMIEGAAHKVVPMNENRRRKQNLGKRLYGGQGENKIGDAYVSRPCRHCNACMIIC